MDTEDVVCVCIYTYTHIYTHNDIYTYIHTMEYYSTIKKNEILPFAAMWMDLENIIFSEISQTERKTSVMISLICGL